MGFIDIEYIDPDTFIFTFGQYKGVHYQDVKHDDPSYLLWCHNNIDWFILDENELEELDLLINGDDLDIDDLFNSTMSNYISNIRFSYDDDDWLDEEF